LIIREGKLVDQLLDCRSNPDPLQSDTEEQPLRALADIAISFGLVNIPVKIFAATGEKSIRFHQIHTACGSRIKEQRWCPKDHRPVERDEISRGYEYTKEKYVLLSEEDFSKIPLETTRNIELSQFTQLSEIDPVFYKQTYFLAPGKTGEKAFQLLWEALNTSGRVGIGKFSLREKEQLVLLRPLGRALALEILYYPDEIRSSDEITELDGLEKIRTNPKELALALQLVESQSEPFHPEQYQDQYRAALERLIEKKIQGQEVVIPPSPEPHIQDLMAALQKSLEEARIRNESEKQRASP
jgi:DNA end-binding protein Ku